MTSINEKDFARALEALNCSIGRLPKVEDECLQLLLEDFTGTIRYVVDRLVELKSSDEQASFKAAEELAREILKNIDDRIRKCEICILLEENPLDLFSILGEFHECLRNSLDEIQVQPRVQGIDAQQSPGEIQG